MFEVCMNPLELAAMVAAFATPAIIIITILLYLTWDWLKEHIVYLSGIDYDAMVDHLKKEQKYNEQMD